MNNNEIYNAISSNIEDAEKQVAKIQHLHTELEKVFNKIQNFDHELFKNNLKEDVKKKINTVWTNEANGIDKNEVVQAYLFEHYGPNEIDIEAYSYGIVDWENFEFEPIWMDMGFDYDFAKGLEADSGIILSYYNPISELDSKEKSEIFGEENYWDIEGFYELERLTELKGLKSCHEAFCELYEEGVFDCINKSNNFLFLLGQHDGPASPILIIQ